MPEDQQSVPTQFNHGESLRVAGLVVIPLQL